MSLQGRKTNQAPPCVPPTGLCVLEGSGAHGKVDRPLLREVELVAGERNDAPTADASAGEPFKEGGGAGRYLDQPPPPSINDTGAVPPEQKRRRWRPGCSFMQ